MFLSNQFVVTGPDQSADRCTAPRSDGGVSSPIHTEDAQINRRRPPPSHLRSAVLSKVPYGNAAHVKQRFEAARERIV